MFLSIQQKFILDTLKKLNCVRRRQIHTLVRGRFQQDGFEITQARMDAMLRQLRAGTADVRMDGEREENRDKRGQEIGRAHV